jgi:hypothetical protein
MLGLEVVSGDGITFAALLTAAGAGIAAGLVTTTVSLIKTAFAKTPVGNWDGMMMAFTLSAFLYVLAAVATETRTLDAALGVFVAWLTCGSAAVGLHKTVVNPLVERVQENTVRGEQQPPEPGADEGKTEAANPPPPTPKSVKRATSNTAKTTTRKTSTRKPKP